MVDTRREWLGQFVARVLDVSLVIHRTHQFFGSCMETETARSETRAKIRQCALIVMFLRWQTGRDVLLRELVRL